jgi:hypothetical protein
VIGAGRVVAEGGGTPGADEHAARHPAACGRLVGAGEGELQVLGRDRIGEAQCQLEPGCRHQRQRGVGDARPCRRQLFDQLPDAIEQRGIE